jgi:EAL domain-containing protein (putative c-di-GMP-specific phosphodiesterase class I)
VAAESHSAGVQDEFKRVLDHDQLRIQFQPVIRVETGAVVGYEALVRGPVGSAVESPAALIKEAYREDRVVEFDWTARACASRAALAAGIGTDGLLLLNIEPLAVASDCPPELWPVIEEAFHKFRVVLEVTERSLDHDPKTLLAGIDRQRPTVSGLAVDDVGADMRTLSMLPALEPDVIKLDLNVTQRCPGAQAMKVLDFAYEEAERTGAKILAEGVETKRHHEVVRELGAPLAQGWLYGKPTDKPMPVDDGGFHERLGLDVALADVRTPFEALRGQTISHAGMEILDSLSREIFTSGKHLLEPALVIVLVPYSELLDRRRLEMLSRLARRRVVVGALGKGMPGHPAPGVRGSSEHDPSLDGELAVITLSPSTAVAMLARQEATDGSRFEFGLTHDRQRIITAARCLLRRLGPRV